MLPRRPPPTTTLPWGVGRKAREAAGRRLAYARRRERAGRWGTQGGPLCRSVFRRSARARQSAAKQRSPHEAPRAIKNGRETGRVAAWPRGVPLPAGQAEAAGGPRGEQHAIRVEAETLKRTIHGSGRASPRWRRFKSYSHRKKKGERENLPRAMALATQDRRIMECSSQGG